MTRGVGTPIYTAPEALGGNIYSQKADVYSFAFVLWELVTRQIPFAELARMSPVSLHSPFPVSFPLPSHFSIHLPSLFLIHFFFKLPPRPLPIPFSSQKKGCVILQRDKLTEN